VLSIYETYCDVRDLTHGKSNVLLDGSGSSVERDPQTDVRLLSIDIFHIDIAHLLSSQIIYLNVRLVVEHLKLIMDIRLMVQF